MSSTSQASQPHRILVADDDPTFRRVLASRLSQAGWIVEACEDGIQALEKLRTTSYDAVLLDYRMPGKTGLEVLAERASAKSADAPFVIITSLESEFQNDEAEALGADGIIFKSQLRPATMAEDVLRAVARGGQPAGPASSGNERASGGAEVGPRPE